MWPEARLGEAGAARGERHAGVAQLVLDGLGVQACASVKTCLRRAAGRLRGLAWPSASTKALLELYIASDGAGAKEAIDAMLRMWPRPFSIMGRPKWWMLPA